MAAISQRGGNLFAVSDDPEEGHRGQIRARPSRAG
jgi:hypothetical protein